MKYLNSSFLLILLTSAHAERQILARKNRRQHQTRLQGVAPAPRRRLERVPDLGVSPEKARFSHPPHPADA